MRAVSAGWESTIRGSHKLVVRATVCTTFQTTTTPTGTRIPVVDGSVSQDGDAQVRSTLDLTTVGVDDDGLRLWPATGGDLLLAPYGNEVYVELGVQYSDDTVEYVGLGYFRIDGDDQDDGASEGPIRLQGQDRMANIVDGRLLRPVQFAAGTTVGAIMNALILDVYPSASISWDDSTNLATITRAVVVEQDRFGFLDDMVKSYGKIWYWDHTGALVIKDLPNPTDPVYTIEHGKNGVEVTLSRHLTRSGVYNAIVATGEGGDTNAPVLGYALDANTDSPTLYGGRFGKVPNFFSSPLLTTNDQCQQAAAALLRKQIGLPYTVQFGTVPNPALEPYDSIKVRTARGGAELHTIKTLSVPLTEAQAMTGGTREQTLVLIGVTP